ncbi:hypothetical protein J3R30DRAFT_2427359 [Lentinula aciculospora]|uniref:Uncharacterized protein n=1 Tax=Lentinula aciculospora TaxID=153920 RepID=A0A9W9DQW1_9AGAR|nr:hypothetical protein J3R30DRAFT_2427359 [Lentinula aciculospora]
MDHHKDVHNSRGSDNAEANIDIKVRSSQEGWLPFEGATVQDEVRLAIDEHVFNEVHQDHSTRREIDNEPDSTPIGAQALSATSSPVASVLQRAGAALSSFKERFSGPIMEAATGPDQTASTGIVGSGVHDSCEIKTKEIGKELFSMKVVHDDITNLQLRYRKYRTRFNANVATMNTKLAQLNSLSSSVSHTKDCLDGLDANFTTAKVDIDCMKGDIDEIRIDVDGMRGDIDQVQYQTDESRMEINGIQNDVQDIRGQVDTILSDVGGVRDDYDIVHEDVTWFQREVSEMRANIEGMRMDLDMRGVERIEQSIDNVREEFRNLRQEWSNWKEEANVDAQIARARTQSTVEVACAGGKDAQLREMAEELLELQKKSDAELTALEAARSQAEHELRIIVALRQEVEHAVSIRVREESTNPQSVMVRSSLKRKYANDSEDIGEVPEASKKMGAHIGAHSAYANDTNRTTSLNADGIFIPSSKRARKLARARRVGIVVVQTATVATVGAVAAWAALAFT